jgi:hypothetical protein
MRRRAERRAPSPSDEPGTPVAINESAGASVVAPAIQPAPPASAEPASVEISLVSDPVTNEMVSMIRSVGSHGCVAMLPRFEAFMRANAAHRHAIDALYLKGYCLYRMGNQDEAVRIWKKVERRQPKSPWLRTVRDWTQPRLPDVSRLR